MNFLTDLIERVRGSSRSERGQGLVELTLTLPILLTLTFGVLELGMLLDVSHSISGLTREGANMGFARRRPGLRTRSHLV